MRVAILSESTADESALRILVERGYLLKKPLDGRTCMYKLAYRRSVSSSERVAKPTHLSD